MTRETLLRSSGINLYGRKLSDITLNTSEYEPGKRDVPRSGNNRFVQAQLHDPDAGLARIYGFTYQGSYHELDPPALFLVHGEGENPEGDIAFDDYDATLAPGVAEFQMVGLAVPGSPFAQGIRAWSYDRADFTLRLDVASGMFEDVLLDAELSWEADEPRFGGGKVGGGKVGGGKVGGGKVGGGKVGGGKVGGGKIGGGKVGAG